MFVPPGQSFWKQLSAERMPAPVGILVRSRVSLEFNKAVVTGALEIEENYQYSVQSVTYNIDQSKVINLEYLIATYPIN